MADACTCQPRALPNNGWSSQWRKSGTQPTSPHPTPFLTPPLVPVNRDDCQCVPCGGPGVGRVGVGVDSIDRSPSPFCRAPCQFHYTGAWDRVPRALDTGGKLTHPPPHPPTHPPSTHPTPPRVATLIVTGMRRRCQNVGCWLVFGQTWRDRQAVGPYRTDGSQ